MPNGSPAATAYARHWPLTGQQRANVPGFGRRAIAGPEEELWVSAHAQRPYSPLSGGVGSCLRQQLRREHDGGLGGGSGLGMTRLPHCPGRGAAPTVEMS
jgi:hypothetical protein